MYHQPFQQPRKNGDFIVLELGDMDALDYHVPLSYPEQDTYKL